MRVYLEFIKLKNQYQLFILNIRENSINYFFNDNSYYIKLFRKFDLVYELINIYKLIMKLGKVYV